MKHVTVRKQCLDDYCNGEYKSAGSGTTTGYGTSWAHECTRCGDKQMFECSYPYSFNEYSNHELEERFE